ncbi:MAG: hypothetical protein WCK35_27000 [Chloroflexota bacterium]
MSLINLTISGNYIFTLSWTQVHPRQLVVGIFILLIGSIFLSIPQIITFLKTNKILAYLIPMHIWIGLVLLAFELVLRLAVFSLPLSTTWTNWFGQLPSSGSVYLSGTEGYSITHFDGSPGEITTPFQGGESIILLGDSYMEARQVPDGKKFASVAETLLRQSGYNFDVHNFGHSGMSMADYVTRIAGYRIIYQPKAFVIQIAPNDFIESFNDKRLNYFIAKDSKITSLFNKNKVKGNFTVSNEIKVSYDLMLWQDYGKSRFDQMLQTQGNNSDDSAASSRFDTNLAGQQMNYLLKACKDTPLILLVIPHAPLISNNAIQMDDSEHTRLIELLKNYPQVTVIDALPEFQKHTNSSFLQMGFNNSAKPGWGHLNQSGNEVLGTLLAKTIEEVLK